MTLTGLIIPLVSFISGFLIGFCTRDIIKDKFIDSRVFVLFVVTTIWALSIIIELIEPTRTTSPLIHGLMGGIVGFFFYKKGTE